MKAPRTPPAEGCVLAEAERRTRPSRPPHPRDPGPHTQPYLPAPSWAAGPAPCGRGTCAAAPLGRPRNRCSGGTRRTGSTAGEGGAGSRRRPPAAAPTRSPRRRAGPRGATRGSAACSPAPTGPTRPQPLRRQPWPRPQLASCCSGSSWDASLLTGASSRTAGPPIRGPREGRVQGLSPARTPKQR